MDDNFKVDNGTLAKRITSINDIEELRKTEPNAKNLDKLISIFSEMDTKPDGILQAEEGDLYYFSDGSISGMKDNKLVIGATASGRIVDMKNEQKAQDNSNIKKYTAPNGKQYYLSPNNKKAARIEADGSISTEFKIGDSFDGTLVRLGIDASDSDIRKAMENANPDAAKRGRFTLDDKGGDEMPVSIPKSVLNKYDLNFSEDSLVLKPKAVSAETKTTAAASKSADVKKPDKTVTKPAKKADSYEEKIYITGENAQKLDAIAERFINIVRLPNTSVNFVNTQKNNINNNKKNQELFKTILGKPNPLKINNGKFRTVNTGDYIITFTAQYKLIDHLGHQSAYWELDGAYETDEKLQKDAVTDK